eukprot:11752722-Alexandrium_andersonii.AAC.1
MSSMCFGRVIVVGWGLKEGVEQAARKPVFARCDRSGVQRGPRVGFLVAVSGPSQGSRVFWGSLGRPHAADIRPLALLRSVPGDADDWAFIALGRPGLQREHLGVLL